MIVTVWFFTWFYALAGLALSLYGLTLLGYALVYLWQRRQPLQPPPTLKNWPQVTIQLPIYNEKLVVERLIDAVAAIEYPPDCLIIQILDDSTDETTSLSRARVAFHQQRGLNIQLIHRTQAIGHKAGALQVGLAETDSEFIAIFDADFLPPPDFLKRLLPYFHQPHIGAVQARWGHLNAEYNFLTRAQALAIDSHHIIEQTVRSRSGLLLNFNGSGGIWRRTCIQAAGGWQPDTLAEDLDLSYRAQLAGWQVLYVPQVVVPAEIPPRLADFKRQQARWAKGSIQVLGKLAPRLLRSRQPWPRKLLGLMHLSGYLAHPLMIIMLLAALPLTLHFGIEQYSLGLLGIGGLGAPIIFSLAQWAGYKNWPQQVRYLPILFLLGIGVAVNNTRAIGEAVLRVRATEFLRTPKYQAHGRLAAPTHQQYRLTHDWTVWIEVFLAAYGLLTAYLSYQNHSGLAAMALLYAAGFGFTALCAWFEQRPRRRGRRVRRNPQPVRQR